MEFLISVFFGELATRSINFFTGKISKPTPAEMEDHLCRVLLRTQVIIEEAMRRHITNQAMLIQLGMVRDAMYRGYYALDIFSYQSQDEDSKDKVMRHASSLSKVNTLKHLYFSGTNTLVLKQLQEALDDLSSMIRDVQELVMFLTSYPRMYREPYSMHLQLSNCMFGRQIEAQLVINFLLHAQPHGIEELDVLPVVGPTHVGKTTLIAHVCKDERVRDHFSEILFFHIHDFMDDELATFKKECAIKHQNHVSDGRLLVVIELIRDLNEDALNRLYSSCKQYVPRGSKIIVTSKNDKIVKFGTTQALTLKFFPHEAYWYFFKTLTFRSTDPKMHPRLAHLAMEIAKIHNTPIAANITASLLRDNFNTHFWCKVLAFLRGPLRKHVSRFGEHPFELLSQNRPGHLRRMATPSEDLVIQHQYQRFSDEEVPAITIQDVVYGSVKPHGKFEILAWRSQIPPYYSYVLSCEIQELKTTATKRKRSIKNSVILY